MNRNQRRQSTTKPTKTNTPQTLALHSKVNNVATTILLRNAKDNFREGNFVYSPVSLEAVLSMLASGSKGKTLDELLDFLGAKTIKQLHSKSPALKLLSELVSSNHNGQGPIINIANAAWVQKGLRILPSYQEVLGNVYKAQAKSVDFQKQPDEVAGEINSWVDKESKGLIKKVAKSDDFRNGDRAMILTNVLYFKGQWEDEFDPRMTMDDKFYLVNGEIVEVPFMKSDESFLYGTLNGFKILEVPYKKGNQNNQNYSMFFLLPEERDGLQRMIKKFDNDYGSLFQRQFELKKKQLDRVLIPKFKISYQMPFLKETLRGMGLMSLFDMKKELTGIVDSPAGDLLFVSKIFQMAFIEVDEKGTEAVAYTSEDEDMGFGLDSPPPPPPSFVADHPFLFMIREKTSNVVLFIGAVLNPKQE